MSNQIPSGAYIHKEIQDRQRMAQRQQRQMAETAERRARAWRSAFDAFPELRCGTAGNPDDKRHPCPWLVWAVLNVSASGRLKRGAVLAERRRLMGGQVAEETREAA